jgi:hypothetical protein
MKDTSTTTTKTASTTTDLSSPFINNLKQNEKNIDLIVKWSTKEKLFLIAFTMINGDSNWSYVSEQLNNWMLITSTYNCDYKSLPNRIIRTPIVIFFYYLKIFKLN